MEESITNSKLKEEYALARMAGYKIEELYCVIVDDDVVICNEVRIRENLQYIGGEILEDVNKLLGLEERGGRLRVCEVRGDEVNIGYIRPPEGLEEFIDKEIGKMGGMLGREVGIS